MAHFIFFEGDDYGRPSLALDVMESPSATRSRPVWEGIASRRS